MSLERNNQWQFILTLLSNRKISRHEIFANFAGKPFVGIKFSWKFHESENSQTRQKFTARLSLEIIYGNPNMECKSQANLDLQLNPQHSPPSNLKMYGNFTGGAVSNPIPVTKARSDDKLCPCASQYYCSEPRTMCLQTSTIWDRKVPNCWYCWYYVTNKLSYCALILFLKKYIVY